MEGLLIYSGGLDSTTLLYHYKDSINLALSFDYGSKHNEKELFYAKWHTKQLKIPHLIKELNFLKNFGSSLLKKDMEIPEGHYTDKSMKSTVVPFRNGIMLAIAVGLAEDKKIDYVYIANHAGDHEIYPDCRPKFIRYIGLAATYGTYQKVKIFAPYEDKNKREIALIGKALGVDYAKTWSCYKGLTYHCGRCGTCLERKRALKGFDETIYKEVL
jgi:7-cyano-7-deazaguanine synthase